MCFHTKQTKAAQQIEKRFKATFQEPKLFEPRQHYNGFAHPKTPIITDENTDRIQMVSWGLLPAWADRDQFNTSYTLNARIETLEVKPAFRDSFHKRCIVLVDGFYEWQHRGKEKIKYEIGFQDQLFALGGLYAINDDVLSYTIVTTEAEGIMREIHNSKLRMPVALKTDEELEAWLHEEKVEPRYDFSAFPSGEIQ